MSAAAEALIAEFEQIGTTLTQLSETIAAELRRGGDAEIAKVDILRPQIMGQIAALNDVVLRAGFLPAGEKTNAIHTAVNTYRPQAGFWAQCDRVLRQQLPPQPVPLERARGRVPTLNSANTAALDELLNVMHAMHKADEQTPEAYEFGCYDDIALPASTFADLAHAAYRVLLAMGKAQDVRFLDVGCGSGMKVLSAAPYFSKCDGIEYQDTSVAAAERLLTATRGNQCKVFQADGLSFDQYDAYQVIYLYKPMRDPEKLRALEQRIVTQAKPGTLLIAPYAEFSSHAAELGCGRIIEHLYLTQSDQEAADEWRQEAELIGLSLPGKGITQKTLWDPIFQASAARGFGVLSSWDDFLA